MGIPEGLDSQPETEDFEVYLYLWGEEISPGAVLQGPSSIDVESLGGMPIYRKPPGASPGDQKKPEDMIGVIHEFLKDGTGLLAKGRIVKGALKEASLVMGGLGKILTYGQERVVKDLKVSDIQLMPKDLGENKDV